MVALLRAHVAAKGYHVFYIAGKLPGNIHARNAPNAASTKAAESNFAAG
jgi:hypothetical protein